MSKISEMWENYNTKKMAKKHGRTFEQQKYRNDLAENLKNMRSGGDDGKEFADTLLQEKKGTIEYVRSLGIGRKVGKETAKSLIENGHTEYVAVNLDEFEGLDKDIASQLLGYMGRRMLANLNKFEGLDKKIADYFLKDRDIGPGQTRIIMRNLDKFDGLDKETCKLLLKTQMFGIYEYVAKNLEKFKGLDKEIADIFINNRKGDLVAKNIDKFEKSDHKEITEKLLEHCPNYVADYLESFKGLINCGELAEILLNRKLYLSLVENIEKFEGVNRKEIAEKIIEASDRKIALAALAALTDSLDKFDDLDNESYEKLAKKLIGNSKGDLVAKNIDKFKGLDHQQIAKDLIIYGDGKALIENIDKFKGLDHQQIAKDLIIYGDGKKLIENIDKFKIETYKELVGLIFSLANPREELKELILHIDKFKGLDEEIYKEIAIKLIELEEGYFLRCHEHEFKGLDEEIYKKLATELIKERHEDIVLKYPEKFGFKKDK